MNFVQTLRKRSELQPGVPALIDRCLSGDRVLTYSGLNRLVDFLSFELREKKVASGDRILIGIDSLSGDVQLPLGGAANWGGPDFVRSRSSSRRVHFLDKRSGAESVYYSKERMGRLLISTPFSEKFHPRFLSVMFVPRRDGCVWVNWVRWKNRLQIQPR